MRTIDLLEPGRRVPVYGDDVEVAQLTLAFNHSRCRQSGMTTPLKTRILLADDHAVVRRGLRLVHDAEPLGQRVARAVSAVLASSFSTTSSAMPRQLS
jgi:hypothetical protein